MPFANSLDKPHTYFFRKIQRSFILLQAGYSYPQSGYLSKASPNSYS